MLVTLQLPGKRAALIHCGFPDVKIDHDPSMAESSRILGPAPSRAPVMRHKWRFEKKEVREMRIQVQTLQQQGRRFAGYLQFSAVVLVFLCTGSSRVLAQEGHSHAPAQDHDTNPEQRHRASALINIVRQSTERFKDVAVAEAEGYALQFGCVSGPDSGAMGLHYVNGDLVKSGVLDPTRPQIVIYEAMPGGRLRLTGADFLALRGCMECQALGSS